MLLLNTEIGQYKLIKERIEFERERETCNFERGDKKR